MNYGSYQDSIELLEDKKSAKCLSLLSMSPFVKYVLPSFLFGLVILISVNFGILTWLKQDDYSESQSTCHLKASYYVPCLPGKKISLSECLELRCCWRDDLSICYHAFPSYYGYKLDAFNDRFNQGKISALRKKSPSGQKMRKNLDFYVRQINENRIRVGLTSETNLYDRKSKASNNKKFSSKANSFKKLVDYGNLPDFLSPENQVQVSKLSLENNSSIDILIQEKPQFAVTLTRTVIEANSPTTSTASKTGNTKVTVLLSTARGPLIITDDYWEWTLYLTSGTLYGLNSLELNGTSNWIYNNENDTMKAAFLAVDHSSGNAISCFVDYDGPLEIQVLNESNLVILRGFSVPKEIGIELMSEPTPMEAIKQLVGAKPSLNEHLLNPRLQGLQLCPELKNFPSTNDVLKSLSESIDSMKSINAPWDSHCLYQELGLVLEYKSKACSHIPIPDQTLISKARELLLNEGKSFVTHLTPMLFDKAEGKLRENLEEDSCLLRNSNTSTYIGLYGGGCAVVYPDWTKPKTHELARDSFVKYKTDLSPDFIVIRDSWPKNEATYTDVTSTHFNYIPEGLQVLMSKRTLPFNLVDDKNLYHYTQHNLYADSFNDFIGARDLAYVKLNGHECNSGVGGSNWLALKNIIQAGVVSAMLGKVPSAMYVCSADNEYHNFNDELCVRWYGAAVMWPRIIVLPEKSPGGKGLSRTGAKQTAKLLRLRAALATYQRTVLANYVKKSYPILSAMSIFYPHEKQPRNTTFSQFFWGESILVGLVILPRRSQVPMWLPGKHAWRHLQGGSAINPTGNGTVSITAAIGQIITFVRPGHIIPVNEEYTELAKKSISTGTIQTTQKSLRLIANLLCMNEKDDLTCEANGRIYYGINNNGEFLDVKLHAMSLTLNNLRKVRSVACDTPTLNQPTNIEVLQFLGKRTFPINQDLCNINDDSVDIDLTKLQSTSSLSDLIID